MSVVPKSLSQPVQTAVFVAVSTLGATLASWAANEASPSFLNAIWYFYGPAWVLVNAFFGGIHNAPSWSFFPSVAIAVFGQNLVLWLAWRWFFGRLEQRRRLRSLGVPEREL